MKDHFEKNKVGVIKFSNDHKLVYNVSNLIRFGTIVKLYFSETMHYSLPQQ